MGLCSIRILTARFRPAHVKLQLVVERSEKTTLSICTYERIHPRESWLRKANSLSSFVAFVSRFCQPLAFVHKRDSSRNGNGNRSTSRCVNLYLASLFLSKSRKSRQKISGNYGRLLQFSKYQTCMSSTPHQFLSLTSEWKSVRWSWPLSYIMSDFLFVVGLVYIYKLFSCILILLMVFFSKGNAILNVKVPLTEFQGSYQTSS